MKLSVCFSGGSVRFWLGCLGLAWGLLGSLISSSVAAADLNLVFIGNLSGASANLAQDQLDGFLLGLKHSGGRFGGVETAVTVINDHHIAGQAEEALRAHLQMERVHFVLISADPSVVAAIAPIAIAAHAFVFSLRPPPANFAGHDCSPNFFSLSGLTETMHEMAGVYLQGQGYHHLAVAMPDSAPARDAVQAFRRGFKGRVTEVISRHGTMNFMDDFKRFRQEGPEAVYLLHSNGMAVNFILQFAKQGMKSDMPLFGPPTTFDQATLAATGLAGVGLFSVGNWSDDLDAPANRRMISDYENEYGRMTSSQAALGYDLAMLLDASVKAVDKKIRDEDIMRMTLRRVDFPNTRGFFRFDTNHFPIQNYLVRQVIEDARERPINEQKGVLQREVRDGHAGECFMRWTAETAAIKN
ncbi:MAG TPA: ABC transporter substrate-binding protein [Rhodospirillaceae bacterium]|nr:ABC transporter substrate-binding protein [Rhodospirillaceae bacterium]